MRSRRWKRGSTLERLVTQGVEAAEQELFEFPAGAGPYPPRGAARRPLTEPVSE